MPDYYTLNADSTYSKVETRLVPESDVQAVKGIAATKQSEIEGRLTETQTKLDEMLARATTAESALQSGKTELEALRVEAAKVPELTTQITDLTNQHQTATAQLLETKRQSLISKYGLKDTQLEKVKSMSSEALTQFEEHAELLGFKPNTNSNGNGSSFDNGSGKGADTDNLSGAAKIRLGLEQGLLSSSNN